MGWFFICRIILDSDADTIVGKVEMHGADADVPLSEQVGLIRVDLTPCFIFTHAHWASAAIVQVAKFALVDFYVMQTISQALATAREHLARSLLK